MRWNPISLSLSLSLLLPSLSLFFFYTQTIQLTHIYIPPPLTNTNAASRYRLTYIIKKLSMEKIFYLSISRYKNTHSLPYTHTHTHICQHVTLIASYTQTGRSKVRYHHITVVIFAITILLLY